jgi:hypothetical protein
MAYSKRAKTRVLSWSMATNQAPSAAIFALDCHSSVPVYQLYRRTRVAIASGQLPLGGRLPSGAQPRSAARDRARHC